MRKRVLITGANSYLGESFEKWLAQFPGEYEVDTVDMTDRNWREKSFAGYDTVFHVAGIAHADTGKVSETREKEYFSINCDLAVEAAKKAKADGIKQFIFVSSISIYGSTYEEINRETIPNPDNVYGKSKLQAEKELTALGDNSFLIAILRPPMIYGKYCKGNYPTLSGIAQKTPFLPYVKNRRSMLYIDNLCEFVRLITEDKETGIFYPQNAEYVNTTDLMKTIAKVHGKKVRMIKIPQYLMMILMKVPGRIGKKINKAFGNLVYEHELSRYKTDYHVAGFEASIMQTESVTP